MNKELFGCGEQSRSGRGGLRSICLWKHVLACLVVCASMAGCGGGGEGGGGDDAPAVKFTPSIINESFTQGRSIEVVLNAKLSRAPTGTVYIRIVDNVGVIDPDVGISNNPDGTFTVTLHTASGLGAGKHTGKLEVRLCHDYACSSQFAGSPVFIPYTLVVAAGSLTELTPWDGVSDWITFQANAAHTAYVPATLDPASFSYRWTWTTPDGENEIEPVVVAGGMVYVTSSGDFADASNVYALSEYDGSEVWHAAFGSVYHVNPPAVADGKVFVATSGHEDTFMWSFNAYTGVQASKTAFSSQWESYYAPTPDGSKVYTNGGYYGGLNAFNQASGSSAWFYELNQYDMWTPAVDAAYAYAYTGENCGGCADAGLHVIDKVTGNVEFTINDSSFEWDGWSLNGAPVLAAPGSVIVVNGRSSFGTTHLVNFDTSARTVKWSVSGRYWGNPAVANGVVYATNLSPYRVEARSLSDGGLLWSWSPSGASETTFLGDVIATENMVLVSTDAKVHAISMSTQASEWSFSVAGDLALSANGVLYVVSEGGSLTAFNLK